MLMSVAGLVLGAHLASLHSAGGLEPFNPGLYLRTESGFTAGVLRNSQSRTSTYAGWTFETDSRQFALTVGGITGYPARPVMPLLVPSMRIGLSQWQPGAALRVSYLPKPPKYGRSHALHFSVEREF